MRVSAPDVQAERTSRIRDVSAALMESEELPGHPTYSAEREQNGSFVCFTGSGIGQAEFIALEEELLAQGR